MNVMGNDSPKAIAYPSILSNHYLTQLPLYIFQPLTLSLLSSIYLFEKIKAKKLGTFIYFFNS